MTTKLVGLALLPSLLVGGMVMNASILVVEVQDEDVHILVPVPLVIAQVALAFCPDEIKWVPVPEIGQYLDIARKTIGELRHIPDAELVTVEDRGELVSIAKEGDFLRIDVSEDHGEEVHVRVPLSSVAAILDSYDDELGVFRTQRIIAALKAAPSGQLVHVLDGEQEVSIRMW